MRKRNEVIREKRASLLFLTFSRLLLSFVSPHASVPFCFNGVFSCFHYKTPIKIERTWHAIPRCYTVIAGEPVVVGVVFLLNEKNRASFPFHYVLFILIKHYS